MIDFKNISKIYKTHTHTSTIGDNSFENFFFKKKKVIYWSIEFSIVWFGFWLLVIVVLFDSFIPFDDNRELSDKKFEMK